MFQKIKAKITKNFNDSKKIFKEYFSGYGDFYEIITSVYFISAIIINIFSYKSWLTDIWMENIQNVIPDIIGFSLGAYAILFSFGNEKFQSFISEKDENKKDKQDYNTMYIQLNITFIHFIIMQVVSLLLSVVGGSLLTTPYGFIESVFAFSCHLIFLYSMTLCIAAVFCIFRLARIYQEYLNTMKDEDKTKKL